MPSLRSSAFVLLLFALLGLSGCGGTAPTSEPRMLVYRGASGEVFDGIRSQIRAVTSATEPSDLNRFQLVTLDGNLVSSAEIGGLNLIRRAFGSGVSVLLVNASESHKRALLDAKLVPLSAHGTSDAYLVTPLPGGRRFHITNLRPLRLQKRAKSQELDPDGTLTGSHGQSEADIPTSVDRIAGFVEVVKARLGEQGRSVPVTPSPPTDYPKSSWFQVSYTDGWAVNNDPIIDWQNVDYDATYTFYGYFDSGDSLPSKWFQWLAFSVDASVTPSAPTSDQVDDRGYVHTMTEIYAEPDDSAGGNGLQLSLVDAQPTNANNALSSSLQFDIGYKGQNGNTSWLWQQGLTQTMGSFGGWSGSIVPAPGNELNGTQMRFMQTTSFNGDGSNWTDALYRVFVGRHIEPINSSSRNPIELVGQALWRTQVAYSGVVTIDVGESVLMTDIMVKNYFFTYKPNYSNNSYGTSRTFDLDLGQLAAP
ncbi:MAG: hypothetical protein K1X67_14505 [Fimbriimonadaceae bacterium]|nr:hypothetical protein [Fimbriimonadaceae bacterium]